MTFTINAVASAEPPHDHFISHMLLLGEKHKQNNENSQWPLASPLLWISLL